MRIEISAVNAIQQYGCVNKKEKAGAAVGMGSDKVELSNNAVAFGALVRQVKLNLSEPPQSYTGKVEDIAQRVKDGSYRVDPELIVEAILN